MHVSDTETFNGLKETKLATLAVGDYNNPLGDALNYLGDIVYRTEEVYMAVEAPETSVDYFWVPVDQVYFEKAKQIPKGKKNDIYAMIINFAVSMVFLDPQREYSQKDNVYMNSDYGICLQKTKSD